MQINLELSCVLTGKVDSYDLKADWASLQQNILANFTTSQRKAQHLLLCLHRRSTRRRSRGRRRCSRPSSDVLVKPSPCYLQDTTAGVSNVTLWSCSINDKQYETFNFQLNERCLWNQRGWCKSAAFRYQSMTDWSRCAGSLLVSPAARVVFPWQPPENCSEGSFNIRQAFLITCKTTKAHVWLHFL